MSEPGGPTDTARMKAALLAAATLAFAAAPAFTGGFRGYDPALFPLPQIDPPVQPATWAFAIWGLIYLGLILHAGAGLLLRADAPEWDPPRLPLMGSLVLGAAWIPTAKRDPLLATVMIFAMLALALLALARCPGRERWLARAPVALYAGWLTAASFVSLGVLVAGYGLAGPEAAAAGAVVLAAGMAVAVQRRIAGSPAYAAAVIWGLAGIVAANLGAGLLLPALGLAAIATVGAAALAPRR